MIRTRIVNSSTNEIGREILIEDVLNKYGLIKTSKNERKLMNFTADVAQKGDQAKIYNTTCAGLGCN